MFRPALLLLSLVVIAACALCGESTGALTGASLARANELKFGTFDDSRAEFERSVRPVLAKYCAECHGADLAEKELNLQALPADMKASTSAARWAVVLTELSLGKMPPQGAPRPSADNVRAVMAWIQAEMKRAGKHVAARQDHLNGNILAHALLFGGKPRTGLEAAPRARPLSPEIYDAFAKDVGRGAPVGQPFTPAGGTTFKDMGSAKLDEPTTSQLIANTLLMVEALTAHKMEGGVAKPERGAPKEYTRLFDEKNPAGDAEIEAALKTLFDHVLRRPPRPEEVKSLAALMRKNIQDAGRQSGVRYTFAAVLLLPEAVMRLEQVAGAADAAGRARLAPRQIAFALAYALTDRRPESWLLAEADQGKLATDEGVAAAVRKMLDDPKLAKPRVTRFFREYFGYDKAIEVFKNPDDKVEHHPRELVGDTDRLIEWILEQDKNVLRELLTTNKAFVNFRWDASKQQGFKARNEAVHLAYGLPPDWKWTDRQPIELPANQRAGVLTQPAWLAAFSKSDDNDAIHRGIWVRERLLGGAIPNVPITVDAQLPIAPEKTLRERMAVTEEAYCWNCHKLINRTAYPFEIYDHYGRFRALETVLDLEATRNNVDAKGKPLGDVKKGVLVNSAGSFDLVEGDALTGDVENAVDFMHKMANSPFVEQVFVRHVFRYWLGRNETAGDAASLQAAHRAYVASGGGFKALLTAVLSSESFLYRSKD